MERSGNFYKAIRLGYILISILIGCMAYNSLYEWQEIEALELGNKKIDELRKEINNINIQMIKFSLLGETILEWNDKDIEHYHARRMAMDSMLCRFKVTYPAERIDSVRSLLEDKERQMFQIVRLMDEQQSINKKIANQIPVIVQKSVQEQSKKPKRKGFLSIFGKKEGTKPTTTTTTLRSSNRNMVNEQKAQSRRLSEQADSLAARNAELNRQLQGLICQIEKKVQSDLQNRESEITAMRKKSFMQIGGLMGFVLLLLVISYIIIHRDAKNIKRYKRKTTDLIEQLEQSMQQNEVLITSRKKAVHTITHELRTPLTAITGYTELLRKECNSGNNGQYIQNILQSSDRMRDNYNNVICRTGEIEVAVGKIEGEYIRYVGGSERILDLLNLIDSKGDIVINTKGSELSVDTILNIFDYKAKKIVLFDTDESNAFIDTKFQLKIRFKPNRYRNISNELRLKVQEKKGSLKYTMSIPYQQSVIYKKYENECILNALRGKNIAPGTYYFKMLDEPGTIHINSSYGTEESFSCRRYTLTSNDNKDIIIICYDKFE